MTTAAHEVRHADGRTYDIRGHRLWVESEGDGPLILLLSGLGPAGSHVIFHPHFDALAATHRVIYADLYGRGRSDRPDDLSTITFEDDVADIAALIEALDVGPVHLYGFSYGGLLSQALALDHAELIRSVVLANSLHSPEMWQANHANINAELQRQYPDVWDRIMRLRARGLRATDPEVEEQFGVHAKLIRFYDPDNAVLLATEPGARNTDLYPVFVGVDVDFMIGGQVAQIPDFRPRLNELHRPVMVLAGRYDRALYPAMQREFVIHNPRIRLEMMERSGSFSHVEEADAVLELVRGFTATADS